ncbi:hypothetical protein [Phenylobacterium sp.]|jgi:hypothetical protein|uniref:hypothetical protein n=1 Tax=Phenylobacterium sp. TaxID=1871053 RepID=UPI002E34B473|nr:hypothetical protein [Phenylobacterium sp.]HEX4709351.1 hypothetical protein [Phenylobacterium sp.]
MQPSKSRSRRLAQGFFALLLMVGGAGTTHASDHLDSPAVAADPRADIGDIYAWTDPAGKRLNLVMTIVGHSFSDKLAYVFHVDSGPAFGRTTTSTDITCRFASMTAADCRMGTLDRATGNAAGVTGLEGKAHRFRVFAGLRDDPFFNNVRGSRAAFNVAADALKAGTPKDAAGCVQFDAATRAKILDAWRHTDGGPAKNLLLGWTPASIVISVDLSAVNKGGPLLAVWGATVSPTRQVDRAGRPLTGNALLAPLAADAVSDKLKDDYNAATPATSARFVPAIQESLGLYDGYDGQCGNGLLGNTAQDIDLRYGELATLLADDRLWVNSASVTCTQLFAVERAAKGRETALARDCGGRAPTYSAVNAYRSLLAGGNPTGIDDGVNADELAPSNSVFPFLRPPGGVAKP